MNLFGSELNVKETSARDNLVKKANDSYYQTSETVLTDKEFDLLAENGLEIESRNYRKKVQHRIPMGSLSKCKDAESLARWLRLRLPKMLVVYPKYDGSSISLSAANGKIERWASRGDGIYGNDLSENARHTQTLTTVPDSFPAVVELRAEAMIPKSQQPNFEKNIRNLATGKLNAKVCQPEFLKLIEFMVFDICGDGVVSWNDKKAALKALPREYRPTFIEIQNPNPETAYEDLRFYYDMYKKDFRYEVDGLVIVAIDDPSAPLPAPSLDPEEKTSVKYDGDGVETTIGGHIWTLGKHDKLTPVLVLDPPVIIDSTTVSRVSASNYSLLKAAGLGIGAEVVICKAGEIIPFCKTVITPSNKGLELPNCPACDTKSVLNATGVDAICPNQACGGKVRVYLQKAFEVFKIEFISDQTINSLVDAGFDTLEQIFELTVDDLLPLDGFAQKSAEYFVNSLQNIKITQAQLIKLVGLRGIGARKGQMLLDYYGDLSLMIEQVREKGQLADIPNFGPKQAKLIEDNISKFETLSFDLGVLGIEVVRNTLKKKSSGKVICCTGACPGFSRNNLAELLAKHSHSMVDRVTADTELVLCADPNGSSSKLKKAREKGLPIMSYEDFIVKELGTF